MQLTVDERPSPLQRVGAAIPRFGLAIVFLLVGLSKLGAASSWIPLFDRIGWGQWFRYLTAAMQVGGALLLVLPRTAAVGAASIACTMVGAIYFDVAVLGYGAAAIFPFVLLVFAVGVGLQQWWGRT
jgi:putative oxidoreductase